MNFLAKILTALVPTLLDWLVKNASKLFGGILRSLKYKKKERETTKRKTKRDELVREIEIATEKNDHERLKELHIALHVLDTDK